MEDGVDELVGHLQKGLATCRHLTAVMHEERQALIDQSLETIESLLVRKMALSSDLRVVLSGLRQWLDSRGWGMPEPHATLSQVVQRRFPAQQALLTHFNASLNECRILEKDNHSIVSQHLRRLNSGVSGLFAKSGILEDDDYSPEPLRMQARISTAHWVA